MKFTVLDCFHPATIQLTFETQEELDAFGLLCNDQRIDDAITAIGLPFPLPSVEAVTDLGARLNQFGQYALAVVRTTASKEYESLELATAFHRNCSWGDGNKYVELPRSGYDAVIPLEDYLSRPDVHVIRAVDIKPEEREGELPEQGYVWI